MIMFHFSSLFYIALERYISYCVWYDILCVFAFFFFFVASHDDNGIVYPACGVYHVEITCVRKR